MNNHIRSSRVTSNVKGQPVGRQPRYDGVYLAIVKQVLDSSGSGRLRVWVSEMGTAEGDNSSWITVNYCSPFFGATPVGKNLAGATGESFTGTQTSYGMWFVPPDVGNTVLVAFANGNKSQGFWLGCIPHLYANRMVPGVASGQAHTNGGKNHKISKPVPQAEYNKRLTNNQKIRGVEEQDDSAYLRPFAEYHAKGVVNQGLLEDSIRGTESGSSRRGPVSNVYGILTPGPKVTTDSTRRKGGSSFVMDDQEGTEKIRLRTRSGSQFLLDETNGIVYIVNRDGTAWVELDEAGNIDVFGSQNITIRGEADVNIRADRDIRMEAGRNIFIKAAKDFTQTGKHPAKPEEGTGGDIYFDARNDMLSLVKKDAIITTETGLLDININTSTRFTSGTTMDIKTAGDFQQESSTIALTSDNIDLTSSGAGRVSGTWTSGGNMYAQDFQTEGVGLVNHTHLQNNGNDLGGGVDTNTPANGGGTGSAQGPGAVEAETVSPEPTVDKTNVEFMDLKLDNINDAIDLLTNKEREDIIKTILQRWVTREPSPEKKRS